MASSPTHLHEEPERQPIGPLVATFVIVFLLALGGLYFFVTQVAHIRAQHYQAQFNS